MRLRFVLADALRGPAEAKLAEAGFAGSLCIYPSYRDVYSARQTPRPRLRASTCWTCQVGKALALLGARVPPVSIDYKRSRIVFQLSVVLSSLR